MKKFSFRKTVICAVCCLSAAISVYADEAEIRYANCGREISAAGTAGESAGRAVTVLISDTEGTTAPSGTAVYDVFHTGIGGAIAYSAYLPENRLSTGRYYIQFISQTGTINEDFMYLKPSDALALVPSVNSAGSSAELCTLLSSASNPFALDLKNVSDESKNAYISEIAGVMIKLRNKGGAFSTADMSPMVRALRLAEADVMLRHGANADWVVKRYSEFLGMNADEYAALPQNVRDEFISLLKKADVSEKEIGTLCRELRILAQIRTAKIWNDVKTVITEESAVLQLDNSYMEKIVNKDDVYSVMFDNLAKITAYQDIKTEYVNAGKTVYGRENPPGGGGTGGSGGGGGGGTSMGVSSDYVSEIMSPSQNSEISFSDLNGYWGREYILGLARKKIVNGYPNGEFQPNGVVTRAEFLKMIISAFEIKSAGTAVFNDVADGDWFMSYCSTAASCGIITGNDDGSFRPNDSILRQDAAVIIDRTFAYLGKTANGTGFLFPDGESISEYAKEAVARLAAAGIMTGSDNGDFLPAAAITRGEAAAVVWRALEK